MTAEAVWDHRRLDDGTVQVYVPYPIDQWLGCLPDSPCAKRNHDAALDRRHRWPHLPPRIFGRQT